MKNTGLRVHQTRLPYKYLNKFSQVQIMESMKVENVTKYRHAAIDLLKQLDSGSKSALDVYFIFNREEAKIVHTFLRAFYTLSRQEISISFWDKSKESIAFVKRQNSCFPQIPTANVSCLKEHSEELEALFSGELDKSINFFNEAREYAFDAYPVSAA